MVDVVSLRDVLASVESLAAADALEAVTVSNLTRLGDLDKLAVAELEAASCAGICVHDVRGRLALDLGQRDRGRTGLGERD